MYNFNKIKKVANVFESAEFVGDILEILLDNDMLPKEDGIFTIFEDTENSIKIIKSSYFHQPTWRTEVSFSIMISDNIIMTKVGAGDHWAIISFLPEGEVWCEKTDTLPSYRLWKDGEEINIDKRIKKINNLLSSN